MPDVPPPEACEPAFTDSVVPGDLLHQLDRRRVDDDLAPHAGAARMWVRTLADDEPITAGLLAVFADFLPGAIPVTRRSTSLDNTLRIRRLVPTAWVLLDTRISGLASGFFHGEMSLFAQDGTHLFGYSPTDGTLRAVSRRYSE